MNVDAYVNTDQHFSLSVILIQPAVYITLTLL